LFQLYLSFELVNFIDEEEREGTTKPNHS